LFINIVSSVLHLNLWWRGMVEGHAPYIGLCISRACQNSFAAIRNCYVYGTECDRASTVTHLAHGQ
jgi:hypothetical protein